MIADIIGWIVLPHIVAFFAISRLAMFEIRPGESNTFREDIARLWAWTAPRWYRMVSHPLYWAATGIISAYFLAGTLRRIFL